MYYLLFRYSCCVVACLFSVSILSADIRSAVNDARAKPFGISNAGYFPACNDGATAEGGESVHGGVGKGHSLWWYISPFAHDFHDTRCNITLRPYEPGLSFVLVLYKVDEEGGLIEQAKVEASDMKPQAVSFEWEPFREDYLIVVDSTSEKTGWFYFAINETPEIHAPLSVAYGANEIISIPVHVVGLESDFFSFIQLTEGEEYFSYDPVGQQIIGSVPSNFDDARVTIRAGNELGYREASISLYRKKADYALTSPASALALVGVPFEYALEFSGASVFLPENLQVNNLPPGLALSLEHGVWKIKGVPRHDGEQWVTIDYDSPDDAYSAELKLEIIDYVDAGIVPEITSPLMAYAAVGQPFSYQIETSLPVDWFDAGLPSGLYINQETGLISGVPSSFDGDITVWANYSGGQIERVLKLVFVENFQQQVEFQVPPILYAYEGVPFEYNVTTSLPVENFDGVLPDGLEINPETGVISGTPGQQDEFFGELRADHPGSGPVEMQIVFHILDPEPLQRVTSPAQAAGVQGEFFEYQLKIEPQVSNHETDIFVNLPPGLSFDSTTRKIFGVPDYDGLDFYDVELGYHQFRLQFQFTEPFAKPEFLNSAAANGVLNNFFYYAFSAPGAESYQIVGGSGLPDGLSFDTNSGVVMGVPLENGNFSLTVRAYKNNTYSDTRLRLTIENESGTLQPVILSPGQMLGEVGELIVYQISSSETIGSIYDVNILPEGFQFDPTSGIIFGISEVPLTGGILVRHGDASASVLLNIYEPEPGATPLLVTSPPSALGEPGQWFDFQIQTNAEAIGAESLEFVADSSWPDELSLDPNTGRITGYLGEDWPPQIGFNIYSSEGETESVLTLVDASFGRPPIIESRGHVMAYEGDYVEYFFEFANPRTHLEVNGFSSGLQDSLQYDPVERKLYGTLSEVGEEFVQFEIIDVYDDSLWAVGELSFDVLHADQRPIPIATSALAPVAEAGELFRYKFEFNQKDVILTQVDSSEDWLRQTGPLEISGYLPGDYTGNDFHIQFDYENLSGANGFGELRVRVSLPLKPVVVTSPASATAYIGTPFNYQLTVDPVRIRDTIVVNSMPDWMSYDPETKLFSGVPDDLDSETIDLTIDSDVGSYSTVIFVSSGYQRPLVTGYTPQPAFLNVPYVLPLQFEGFYEEIRYGIDENFSFDPEWSALTGIPGMNQGSSNADFVVFNPDWQTRLEFDIRHYESAPVILEDPVSMVSFLGGKAYFKAFYGGEAFGNGVWLKDFVPFSSSTIISTGDSMELNDLVAEDQGDYTFLVENEIGFGMSHPAGLTLSTPKKLRDWTIAHVGELIDLQPGGEPEESWAKDGISNQMKWAMGLPLIEPFREPLVGGEIVEGKMQIQFLRNSNAEDVTIVVERSESLAPDSWVPVARRFAGGSWKTLVPSASVSEEGLQEVKTVYVRDDRTGGRGFLRVRVAQAE